MTLSIIIVNWNVKTLLSRLLDSIFKFTPTTIPYEIIVIDNNSSDGSVELLKTAYSKQIIDKKLKIIANDFNAGFAKANNQGLAAATGDFIVFMNPDMELIEDSFGKLLTFMNQRQEAAVCCCRLLYEDETTQPTIKNDPTLCSQIFVLLKLHHFLHRLPCLTKYLAKNFNYNTESEVNQAMGAFLMFRKETIKTLRGWDEDFWLWWEDLDLCRRARKNGAKLLYTPTTQIIHYEGRSFAQTFGLAKQKRFNRGMLLYFKKHHSRAAYLFLSALQPISFLLTLLTQLLKIKPRTQSTITK
jgi:GT2 family glycosyltransferase